MPLYQQLVLARDIARHSDLTRLFRECTRAVQSAGGSVRAIENHGIRALHHRLRNNRALEEEQKFHWRARYVSAYIDASPKGIQEVERILRLSEDVLRFHRLRPKTRADFIRRKAGWKSLEWESAEHVMREDLAIRAGSAE